MPPPIHSRAEPLDLLDYAIEACMMLDHAWRITYCNARAADLLARPRSALVGQPLLTLFPALAGTRFEQHLRHVANERLASAFDEHVAGDDRWFGLVIYPTPAGITIQARDITAERRVREALQANEARLALALEATREGLWDWSPEAPALQCSDLALALLDHPPSAGAPTLDAVAGLVHPNDLGTARATLAAHLDGSSDLDLELRLRTRAGLWRWVQIRGRVHRDAEGRIVRAAGTIADIAERKQAETSLAMYAEALEAGERRWRALFDSSVQCFALLTSAGAVLEANRTLLEAAGIGRDALVGRRLAAAPWWSSGTTATALLEALHLAARGSTAQFESTVMRHDGTAMVLHATLTPVPGRDGLPHLIVFEGHDLTEMRAAEAKRAAAEAAAFRAEQLESLGALAGGLAHDFNNALVGILGHAALARRTPGVTALADPLAGIEEAARRAAGLVRQLAAFAGQSRTLGQPLDLAEIAEHTVAELTPAFGTGIDVQLTLSRRMPPVPGDAASLRQLIVNLLANAIEAVPDAAGRIELRLVRQHVDPAALGAVCIGELPPAGDYAVLEVRDNGRGIPPQARASLFRPYFSTKPAARGLGLTVVLGIVRAHGGAITIGAGDEGGTQVRVYLPLAGTPTSSAAMQPTAAWNGSGTVLVIDDDPGVRLVVADLLQRRGFRVLTASNGREGIALATCADDEIRGVVLDLTMPGLSGAPTLESLRRARPDLPVVLMSGYEVPTDADSALAPDGFLAKPFSDDDFYSIVGKALRIG